MSEAAALERGGVPGPASEVAAAEICADWTQVSCPKPDLAMVMLVESIWT